MARMTKKALGRFISIYEAAPDNAKNLALKLISNALFMEEQLEILQKEIREKGIESEYQNGANQWGTKRSPAVDVYNSMIKNYCTVMRQLEELLPTEENGNDELMDFLGGVKR